MKKLAIAIVLCGVILVSAGQEVITQVYHCEFILLRAEADEDAPALDLTTKGDFANKPDGAIQIKSDDTSRSIRNKIEIIFCGGSEADKTFTYKVYGWRKINGPARLLCTGVGTLGTQAVVKYPHSAAAAADKFWADTLTCTSRWLTQCSSSDSSGNNEIASLGFSINGYEWIFVEISSADGSTGDEAGDVSAYYAYWS